jgi:hypothetical protein
MTARDVAAEVAMAGDLVLALDPVRLAERAGIVPDPWQLDLLRSGARQMILLCSRQAGKSTVSAVVAVHEAVYRPPALVLLLSPSLRQSQELYRKVRFIYGALGGGTARPAEESALRLELCNGSRIVCLPGKEATIRGYSGVALLIIDEASRVPDELYQAMRPMLAVSGGRLILLSTPFGKRGFFYREWSEGGADWHRTSVTADQVPRISTVWLEAERAAIGDWWYRQEYGCVFVDAIDSYFRSDDIAAAGSPDVVPLFGGSHAAKLSDRRRSRPDPRLYRDRRRRADRAADRAHRDPGRSRCRRRRCP